MPKLKKEERRKELIAHLVGNCDCKDNEPSFTEDDSETLEKMTDEQLEGLAGNAEGHPDEEKEQAKKLAAAKKKKADEDAKKLAANEAAKAAKQKQDEDEAAELADNSSSDDLDAWLEKAPSGVRSVVRNALASEDARKDELIEAIVANKKNVFTEDQLYDMELPTLEGIAKVSEEVSNSEASVDDGEGTKKARHRRRSAVSNSKKGEAKKIDLGIPLELPSIDWAENAKSLTR